MGQPGGSDSTDLLASPSFASFADKCVYSVNCDMPGESMQSSGALLNHAPWHASA
jgi:hypothetical protein